MERLMEKSNRIFYECIIIKDYPFIRDEVTLMLGSSQLVPEKS